MQLSPTTKILLAAALAPLAFSDELEAEDVPSACAVICGPLVSLTTACDNHRKRRRDHGSDDDHGETQCVCNNTSFDVRGVAALCASCISQNGRPTNDMDEIMSRCGFSSTTYSPAVTTAVSGITVQATRPMSSGSGGGSNIPTGTATRTPAPGSTTAGVAIPGTAAQGRSLGVARLTLVMAGVAAAAWLF